MGINLPGSYCDPTVDTQEKITAVVDSLTPQVLDSIYTRLEKFIQLCLSQDAKTFGSRQMISEEGCPATTPPECISRMFTQARRELDRTQRDTGMSKVLLTIRRLDEFTACGSLFQHLEGDEQTRSCFEFFTDAVVSSLQAWDLPAMELEPIHHPTDEDDSEQEDKVWYSEQEDEAWSTKRAVRRPDQSVRGRADLEEVMEDTADEGDTEEENADQDPKRVSRKDYLTTLLARRVKEIAPEPMVFNDWRCPTGGPLLGFAPARFNLPPFALPPLADAPQHASAEANDAIATLLGTRAKIASDIATRETPWTKALDARNSMQAQMDPPIQLELLCYGARRRSATALYDYHEMLLEEASDYVSKIIATQTAEERALYKSICRRMSTMVDPPIGARGDIQGTSWSATARDSSWWQCRELLAKLADEAPFRNGEIEWFERQIMLLLAAVEGGSTEAVAWLIPLDGLLRQLSRRLKQYYAATATTGRVLVKPLSTLTNLTTLVHAVALNNLLLRLKVRRVPENDAVWKVQAWYAMLFRMEPGCANHCCLRDLPPPLLVGRNVGGMFSVGARECRAGACPREEDKFPCLVSWLRYEAGNPVMLLAFNWVAEIFHTVGGCRYPGRMKWPENF